MATTKIWPVHDNLARVLEYAENHLKTANPNAYTAAQLNDLHAVLDYAANTEKTAKQFYVTGVNCIGEQSYQQMSETKMRFGKSDRNLAYHAYQSFAPDEVTPQQCHDIGKLLAKRLWGDRYEVVVSTHLNTHCVHNHFVINSVSFVDGTKFNNDFAMYFKRLRAESDRICLERGLSVIENPKRSKNKWLEEAEKRGEPTKYNVFKLAIDRAIAGAMTAKQFESILKAQGFEMKLSGKYWTIKMAGGKRPTRPYQLGENYTSEAITRRILANERPRTFIPAQKSPRKQYRLIGSFHTARKLTGYRALYFYYLYRMGKLPKRVYEDHVIGKLSDERFQSMSGDYEAEQRQLKADVARMEADVAKGEEVTADFQLFLANVRKYTDITELTPTILNEFISRIEVHAPDKSTGKRVQQIDIFYNAVGVINIPTSEELAAFEAEHRARKQQNHISA